MAATNNQTVTYILQNKGVVQAHMRMHEKTWGPSLPPLADDENCSSIKVFIRTRPLLPVDLAARAYSLVAIQPSRTLHFTHSTVRSAGGRFATKTFEVDGVFGEDVTNDEVCMGLGIAQLLYECTTLGGVDTSILAYGQTGTGKTFSTTAVEEHIISQLFSSQISSGSVPEIAISAFEIRGNASYDLLSNPPLAPVKIQTASSGEIAYNGLSVHQVVSKEDASMLVSNAKALRMTRSTEKNSASSRSHSILRIRIRPFGDETSSISTLNVIDLAGSERSHHMNQNNAERVKEAIENNKSLAVLKDCIRSLVDPSVKHTPWRGSKLTTVLKTAFQARQTTPHSRRSKLVILGCVSPSALDSEDTLNTLRYVAVFRLSNRDFEGSVEVKGRIGSSLSEDPDEWDHDESVAYITRNFPKLAPLVHRVLPTPQSTISSLLGLSSEALRKLCATPSLAGGPVPDARTIAQANSWIDVYQRKLGELTRKAGISQPQGGKNKSSAIKALNALNGKDTKVNETGAVSRVDWRGKVTYE